MDSKINEKFAPEQARKAFNEAKARDEYDYLIDVLFAEAALETRQTNWDKVLAIYTQIEEDFPSDPRAAEAALKRLIRSWLSANAKRRLRNTRKYLNRQVGAANRTQRRCSSLAISPATQKIQIRR